MAAIFKLCVSWLFEFNLIISIFMSSIIAKLWLFKTNDIP